MTDALKSAEDLIGRVRDGKNLLLFRPEILLLLAVVSALIDIARSLRDIRLLLRG